MVTNQFLQQVPITIIGHRCITMYEFLLNSAWPFLRNDCHRNLKGHALLYSYIISAALLTVWQRLTKTGVSAATAALYDRR